MTTMNYMVSNVFIAFNDYRRLEDNNCLIEHTNLGGNHELSTGIDADDVFFRFCEVMENVQIELHLEFGGLYPLFGLSIFCHI